MALQNQSAITAFLAGKGLTSAQIAGVEGNLQIESSGAPTAYNSREGAIGLAQWEGGRRTNLQHYAASLGTTETDLNAQLGFLWSELTGPEHGALVALTAATTPAAAATAFDQKYERSSAASLPARVAAAEAIAAGGIQGGSGVPATGGGSSTGGGSTGGGSASPAGFLGLTSISDEIRRFFVNSFLIVAGVVLVVVALVLVAKAGDSAGVSPALTGGQAPAAAPPRRRGGVEGTVEHTAEDAAEVAA